MTRFDQNPACSFDKIREKTHSDAPLVIGVTPTLMPTSVKQYVKPTLPGEEGMST